MLYGWQIWFPIHKAVFSLCWRLPSLRKYVLGWCRSICLFFYCSPLPRKHTSKNITKYNGKFFLPKFPSMSVMVSGLTLKSLIHFEFIFVYSVRKCKKWKWTTLACPFSPTLETYRIDCLYHCIFSPPLLQINWPYKWGFISVLSILFHSSIFLFLCQHHTVLIIVTL